LKYEELRRPYPHLPSRYAYTACQDAAARAKSFLKRKEKGLTNREYPEVRRLSVWLDDHLWKPNDLTIEVTTHRGWIAVELEPHKHFWSYVNGGWKISSEARVRLDRRERRLVVYLVFIRYVEEYEPRGFVTVDVNENNVAALIDGNVHLFETGFRDLVLGYYYRRKRIQEKYGANSRSARKVMRKLKERKKKQGIKWKLASLIVRTAEERKCAIVLERLGKNPARGMINHIKDEQLRHRIYQTSFRGVQTAIEEKAREHGVPILYVNPRNTSKICPLHGAKMVYSNGSRVGKCTVGGKLWHRDVAACTNLLLKALRGDGSNAPSPARLAVDGSPPARGSTAAHEPTPIAREAWARWKRARFLRVCVNEAKTAPVFEYCEAKAIQLYVFTVF
jgi:IS605 OrfB family transposase